MGCMVHPGLHLHIHCCLCLVRSYPTYILRPHTLFLLSCRDLVKYPASSSTSHLINLIKWSSHSSSTETACPVLGTPFGYQVPLP